MESLLSDPSIWGCGGGLAGRVSQASQQLRGRECSCAPHVAVCVRAKQRLQIKSSSPWPHRAGRIRGPGLRAEAARCWRCKYAAFSAPRSPGKEPLAVTVGYACGRSGSVALGDMGTICKDSERWEAAWRWERGARHGA